MKIEYILHVLRNPYGKTEEDMKEVRLAAADKIEDLLDAYTNMREFAENNGLDVTTRGLHIGER